MKTSQLSLPRILGLVLPATLLLLLAACSQDTPAPAQMYHCPMHPEYTSDHPGSCPICGMDLLPIEKEPGEETPSPAKAEPPDEASAPAAHDHGAMASMSADAPADAPSSHADVALDAATRQRAGVEVARAVLGKLATAPRGVGLVVVDESRVHHLHTKISGWVEDLFVASTGQPVREGEKVLTLYSPELLAAQEEYLLARRSAARFAASQLDEVRHGGEELLQSARRRLELLDLTPSQIDELGRTGKASRTVTVMAPMSGNVTEKRVLHGMQVDPTTELMTITDFSYVRVEADFYPFEAAGLAAGQKMTIELPHDPGKRLEGRISLVYPYLDPQSRTIKVRIDLHNPDLALKPGMYVDVIPQAESRQGVLIPDSAVLDTGTRQVLFVATETGFEPREVQVLGRADGMSMIGSGLRAGEEVAVQAAFLLDSESRLRASFAAATRRKPGAEP